MTALAPAVESFFTEYLTAQRGASTRVETMVAIELAASCSPFRKSNSSAIAISAISSDPVPMKPPAPRDQSCSMTMALMRLATSSKRSITFSRWL